MRYWATRLEFGSRANTPRWVPWAVGPRKGGDVTGGCRAWPPGACSAAGRGTVGCPVASGRQLLCLVHPLEAAVAMRLYFNSEKIWCLWLMISDASACINCHDVRKRGEGLRACPTWGPRLPWPGGPVAPAASPRDPVPQPCLALTLPVLRLDAPAHVLPALGTH